MSKMFVTSKVSLLRFTVIINTRVHFFVDVYNNSPISLVINIKMYFLLLINDTILVYNFVYLINMFTLIRQINIISDFVL